MCMLYFQKLVTKVDSWLFYFFPLFASCHLHHWRRHFPRDCLIHKKRRSDLQIMSFLVVSCQSFCFYIRWPKPWSWSKYWNLANWLDPILCSCICVSNSESQDISVGAGLFWIALVNHLSALLQGNNSDSIKYRRECCAFFFLLSVHASYCFVFSASEVVLLLALWVMPV